MKVVVTSKMNQKNMFDFLLRHSYFSFRGYIGLLISICAFGAAIYTFGKMQLLLTLILLGAGSLFTIVQPILLYNRAKLDVSKGGQFHVPITYTLSTDGIELARNGNQVEYGWDTIHKVITTKYAVVLYSGQYLTFILTKEGIGEQFDLMKELIQKNASAKYKNIKK